MQSLWAMICGFFLDLIFGDPHWLPHPVRFMGWLIARLEKILRRLFPKTVWGEMAAGSILVGLVSLISVSVPLFLLWLCSLVHPLLGLAVETLMCYQLLAVKSLKQESMKVFAELGKGDLVAARKAVSMIVGRDTEKLEENQVIKAAVETVAENTSDGVAAPLLFIALGGAPLGFFYKAVNTMDSMIGYKNDKYLYFGRTAAKTDDVMNFLPARICSWLMIFASLLMGFDAQNALRIYRRDRHKHSSPNSAHTESVCAGALHIQLAGDAYYFGKLVKKPLLGDDDRPVEKDDIKRANRLLYAAAFLMVLLCGALRFLLASILQMR